MVFPVVMYGCESWTVKKAEHRRIDAPELWCWRRLLRVPWTARRSNQSILKEISPGCSLEGLMLRLKLQYFGHLKWRVDSLEKTLMLGGIWGQEEKGTTEDEMAGWHHWLDVHEFEWTPGVGDGQGGLVCCDSWVAKRWTWLSDWTELTEDLRRVLRPGVMVGFLIFHCELQEVKKIGLRYFFSNMWWSASIHSYWSLQWILSFLHMQPKWGQGVGNCCLFATQVQVEGNFQE